MWLHMVGTQPPASAIHPLPLPACLPACSVVLDEAQLVANSSSVAALVASSLWRRHAWVVTGTPIASRLDEIKGGWCVGQGGLVVAWGMQGRGAVNRAADAAASASPAAPSRCRPPP